MRASVSAIVRRVWRGVSDLLPSGGIGMRRRPPDMDGRREADLDYGRAILITKTQMSPGGKATTTFESVERTGSGDR